MALIICPECGKEYSDLASACPNCACPTSRPVRTVPSSDVPSHVETSRKHGYGSLLAVLISVALVAVGAWYIYRVQSYNNGLSAMYNGEYSAARSYLDGINYKDSNLVLNDISFLEDLEQIIQEEIARGDANFDISADASRTLRKLSKYQTIEFHTDGLDEMLDQYTEGLERIINAFDYEAVNAVEYEILAGAYYCDHVIVNLHDNIGFMRNDSEYEAVYSNILPREEEFLTAFNEVSENGQVPVKDGNFWTSTVSLFLRNDTNHTFEQAFVFNFYSYSGEKFLETVTTDVLKIAPNSEYTVSINVPQSARNGYNVNYSYYILSIDDIDFSNQTFNSK